MKLLNRQKSPKFKVGDRVVFSQKTFLNDKIDYFELEAQVKEVNNNKKLITVYYPVLDEVFVQHMSDFELKENYDRRN